MQKSDSFDLLFDFNKDYYKKKLKRLKDLIKTKIDEEKLDIDDIKILDFNGLDLDGEDINTTQDNEIYFVTTKYSN